MGEEKRILVTGATGKVGRQFIDRLLSEPEYDSVAMRALCHNRLRAPWIMEKDDFKYQLSFGEDVFGGPCWRDLVGPERADEYIRTETLPVMLDARGEPMRRNFVHLNDLVDALLLALDHPKARQQTFNICMDEPVDYPQ